MSTIQANAILDASGGNTATVNGITPLSNSARFGRNLIINGAMGIDQRNNGASVANTTSPLYVVDRWQFYSNVATKLTAERSTVAPAGFYNSIKITSTSAYTPAAGNRFVWNQVIEGVNTSDLLWGTANAKTVTLSFWVRSSLTGTFSGDIHNPAGTPSYVFTFTISSADTWEYKTITIPGPTTGTWNTGTTSGSVIVSFNLGAGSNFLTSTTNTWQSAFYEGSTGSVSLVSTNAATLYMTGVQLETGSVATEFEHRPYGTELQLCQRYYHQGMYAFMSSSATTLMYNINFPVTMRTTPTETHRYPEGAGAVTNDVYNIATAATPTFVPDGNFADVNGLRFAYDFDAGLTADDGYQSYFTFSSEL